MRLILEYDYGGGPESVVGYATLPIEYESEEALLVDFEKALLEARKRRAEDRRYNGIFQFAGYDFDVTDFIDTGHWTDPMDRVRVPRGEEKYELPEIFELEAWYERRLWDHRF